jgi:hypothetical protein
MAFHYFYGMCKLLTSMNNDYLDGAKRPKDKELPTEYFHVTQKTTMPDGPWNTPADA